MHTPTTTLCSDRTTGPVSNSVNARGPAEDDVPGLMSPCCWGGQPVLATSLGQVWSPVVDAWARTAR